MLNIIHIKDVESNSVEMEESIQKAMSIINLYPEWFPHLVGQGFKLKKYFDKGGVILQDGVVVTFSRYKSNGKLSRNATALKKSGDFILHQIASDRVKKDASKIVLDEFVEYCKRNHAENLWLTVREKNERAVNFYKRYGFVEECKIQWSSKKEGVIPGIIFRLKLIADKNIENVCK